jgi:hypothetical protein
MTATEGEEEDRDEENGAEYDEARNVYTIEGNEYHYDARTGGYVYTDPDEGLFYYYFPGEDGYTCTYGDKYGFTHENGQYYTLDEDANRYYSPDRRDYFDYDEEDDLYYSKDGEYFYYYDEGFEYELDEQDEDTDDEDGDADNEEEKYYQERYYCVPEDRVFALGDHYYAYDREQDVYFIDEDYEAMHGRPETYGEDEYYDFEDESNDEIYYLSAVERYYLRWAWYERDAASGKLVFAQDMNRFGYYRDGHYWYYNGRASADFRYNQDGKRIYDDDHFYYGKDTPDRYGEMPMYQLKKAATLYDKVGASGSGYRLKKTDEVQVIKYAEKNGVRWARVLYEQRLDATEKMKQATANLRRYYDEDEQDYDEDDDDDDSSSDSLGKDGTYKLSRIGYVRADALTPDLEWMEITGIKHKVEGKDRIDSFSGDEDEDDKLITVGAFSLSPFLLVSSVDSYYPSYHSYYDNADDYDVANGLGHGADYISAPTAVAKENSTGRGHSAIKPPRRIPGATGEDAPTADEAGPAMGHGKGVFGKTGKTGKTKEISPHFLPKDDGIPTSKIQTSWIMAGILIIAIITVGAVLLYRRKRGGETAHPAEVKR